MMETTCAFTGHRPKSFPWKYNEAARECVLLKETLAAQITALAEQGVTDYLSGMALGTDLWSAQIVLDLQISCVEAPCYPSLRRTGEQMDGPSAGAVSCHSGTGQQCGLCKPDIQIQLYAGTKPLSGRSCVHSAGCLQRDAAKRDRSHGQLCPEAGPEDHCNRPAHPLRLV